MGLFEDLTLILGVITFLAIILYVIFGGIYRAFQRVGFTQGEAALILLGTFIGGRINLRLFEVNDWVLAINVGGAIVPIVVAVIVLRRNPSLVTEAFAGAAIVALVTYLVTTPTEQGIVSPFPLYLLPIATAAGLSLVAFWREEAQAAPLAYMIGTLGAVIGADVFRLAAFLSQTPDDPPGFASIGGGAVLDMVYLTGILAVALDGIFFNRLRKEQDPSPLPYAEHPIFRSSSSAEFIRDYQPNLEASRAYGTPQPKGFVERAREAAERARAEPPKPAPDRDERVARHAQWEEKLRGRRELP